jgi:hypothetical protein
MTTPEEFLAPGGRLAARLAGWEARPQPLEMATLVAEASAARTHAIVEAGTGVGKSLAYLVPAVLAATADQAIRGLEPGQAAQRPPGGGEGRAADSEPTGRLSPAGAGPAGRGTAPAGLGVRGLESVNLKVPPAPLSQAGPGPGRPGGPAESGKRTT